MHWLLFSTLKMLGAYNVLEEVHRRHYRSMDGNCYSNTFLNVRGEIQYRLYRKPPDSRLYLNTDSFHPPVVFKSAPFSRMLRVINRNSRDDTAAEDFQELMDDLIRCGHSETKLEELEPEAGAVSTTRADPEPRSCLVPGHKSSLRKTPVCPGT